MTSATDINPLTLSMLRESVRHIHQTAGLTRGLRSREPGEPLAIGVTSPNNQEGKSTIAMALAGSLADDLEADVTLVDADFRTHSLEREFGLSGLAGLSEALRGQAPLDQIRHPVPASKMSVIVSGSGLYEADRRARSDQALRIVEELKETSQYVVLDLPSTLNSSTGSVLANLCDGVIVVVRSGHTTTSELELALSRLSDANVLGVVINRWTTFIPIWLQKLLALRP